MLTQKDKQSISETLEKPMNLNEAPASATVRVWIDGYGVLLTMRSDKVKDVVEKLVFIIDKAKKEGWKPTWKKEEPEPETVSDAPTCPVCNKSMVKRKGAKGAFWGCPGYPECKGTRQI